MEQAAAADAEEVDEERGGASRVAIGDAAAPPQEDAMPDGGPPPPPPPRARWATTPPRAADGTTSDEDDYLLSTDHRPASMPSWSPMPSPLRVRPRSRRMRPNSPPCHPPMPSALVDATAVGATHAAALSTAAAAAPPPGTVGTPGRARVQRARAALVTGMPSLRSLTAEALAERQAALSELVASLQVQKAALTTLSELDADAGVATLLKRYRTLPSLGEELRRTRAMVGDGAPATAATARASDGGGDGGDGRAVEPPTFTSRGRSSRPHPPSPARRAVAGRGRARSPRECAASRRLLRSPQAARLPGGAARARVEAKATVQLPADVRSAARAAARGTPPRARVPLAPPRCHRSEDGRPTHRIGAPLPEPWLETQVILSEAAETAACARSRLSRRRRRARLMEARRCGFGAAAVAGLEEHESRTARLPNRARRPRRPRARRPRALERSPTPPAPRAAAGDDGWTSDGSFLQHGRLHLGERAHAHIARVAASGSRRARRLLTVATNASSAPRRRSRRVRPFCSDDAALRLARLGERQYAAIRSRRVRRAWTTANPRRRTPLPNASKNGGESRTSSTCRRLCPGRRNLVGEDAKGRRHRPLIGIAAALASGSVTRGAAACASA